MLAARDHGDATFCVPATEPDRTQGEPTVNERQSVVSIPSYRPRPGGRLRSRCRGRAGRGAPGRGAEARWCGVPIPPDVRGRWEGRRYRQSTQWLGSTRRRWAGFIVRAGQQRAGGRGRPGAVRSEVHVRLPKGRRDRPTCAHDAGWGDRRLGIALGSLTTDGCMCVAANAGHRRWPADGWRSHTRSRDSRVGASFVRRAIADRPASVCFEAVAQWPARPTVSREIAGSSPVGFVRLL